MALISTIDTVEAIDFSLLGSNRLLISAKGTVPTSGWSSPRLSPRVYATPPADGVWDFDFEADAPIGMVLQVLQSFSASGTFPAPHWLKGVRVRGENNSIESKIVNGGKAIEAPALVLSKAMKAGHVIYKQTIASYEDSWQPIGFCSGFGSIKMKKLKHDLVLTIEGPDGEKIKNCIERSIGIGLIAAIIAAYVTGGAALPAAISAFLASIESCLGEGFSVRFDDHSDWVKWCT